VADLERPVRAAQDGQLPPPVGAGSAFTRMPPPASPFQSDEMQLGFDPPPPTAVDQITAIPIQARGVATSGL